MAIKIDINSSEIFAVRDAVRELEKDYSKLTEDIKALNSLAKENNGLTVEQTKALNDYNEQLKQTNSELNVYYKELDEFDPNNLTSKFEDVYGSMLPLSTQIGELEDRLYALKMAGEGNSEEFGIIAERVATMKATIKETDKEMDLMVAGSMGIAGMTDNFKNLGASLLTLNFKDATTSAQAMTNSLKGIDVNKMSKDFSGFAKTLSGTLGQALKTTIKTVGQLTKAMLANPIFLIAAVVAVVVVAIGKLLDELGVLDDVLDALMVPINFIIDGFKMLVQGLKDFGDWLGITNYKEKEYAEENKKRTAEVLDLKEKEIELKNRGLQRDINELERKENLTNEEIDQIVKLKQEVVLNEMEKTQAKINAINAEIKALEVKKKLSDEEKEQLKEQQHQIKLLNDDLVNFGVTIGNIAQDGEKKKATIKDKADKDELAKQKEHNDKMKALAEKRKKEQEDLQKKIVDARKIIAQTLYDYEISLIEKQYDKEYKLALDKINEEEKEMNQRLDFVKADEEERERIRIYYDNLRDENKKKRQTAIDDEQKKADDKEIARLERIYGYDNKLKELELNEDKKFINDSITEFTEYYTKLEKFELDKLEKEKTNLLNSLADTKENAEERQRIIEYYAKLEENIRKETLENIDNEEKKILEKKKDDLKNTIAEAGVLMSDMASKSSSAIAMMLGNTISAVSGATNQIIDILNDKEASIADKITKIASAALGMVSDILGQISNVMAERMENDIQSVKKSSEDSINYLNNQRDRNQISEEEYAKQKYKLDTEMYNKEESIRKAAFEQDKKMKIAQASIAIAQGLIAAWTSSMALPAPASFIMGGVLSAAIGTIGALNIAKIKQTQYQSQSAPPAAPSISMPSTDVSTPVNVDNRGTDTGQTNRYSENNQTDNKQEISVNATISVSEIEDTSKKINGYKTVSEL
jgi:DNA repair exonuclease SbcCD ATPase subunit